MKAITLAAPAKTNLWLRVLRRREDGFHDIVTRIVQLNLADTVHLEAVPESRGASLTCSDASLPVDESNLALKALRALESRLDRRFGVRIHIDKAIPHGAGLGGGSSDAAAVLRGLNQLHALGLSPDELADIGATFGSDVPVFAHASVCDCEGRGEIVTPVEFAWELPIFLMKPPFGVPTPWAYQRWRDSAEIPGIPYTPQVCPWGVMENDLERPVFQKHLLLARMKKWLLDQREVHAAILSGSGSCLLAVLNRNDRGRILEERARQTFGQTLWTWVGHTLRS
ncbi:MAG: 4-(cytidine 5'-diphospho)-2-C-methyl-D-erythritol kinase [Verrucomicrobiales bacterium]|nr:4-(cytidine 5'-diphospho)-2-C-methyl-D-erythritol kinase [Verrucomicrobiales bacterium]